MKLFSKKIGDKKKVLIILHGLFGASDNWYSVAKLLSQKYTIHLLDIRNHGRSPHSPIHSYQSMLEDLVEYFKNENISKATLVGHSMGGKLAMYLALQQPEFVENLFVVDTAARNYSKNKNFAEHKALLTALQAIDLSLIKKRVDLKLQMTNKIWENYSFGFLSKNISRNNDNRFSWKLNLKALSDYIEEIADGFPIQNQTNSPQNFPVTFIKGEQSNYILESDKKEILTLFPSAKFILIKEVGHWIHAQNSKALAYSILV